MMCGRTAWTGSIQHTARPTLWPRRGKKKRKKRARRQERLSKLIALLFSRDILLFSFHPFLQSICKQVAGETEGSSLSELLYNVSGSFTCFRCSPVSV